VVVAAAALSWGPARVVAAAEGEAPVAEAASSTDAAMATEGAGGELEKPLRARPFGAGERLTFDVSLLGIRAAQVNLNVASAGDGFRFVAKGQTVGATDSLLAARQDASCSVDETLTPSVCRFMSESRSGVRRRELRFDDKTGMVRERTLHKGKTTEQEVHFDSGLADVQDALSGLYLLRTQLPAAPGGTVTFRSMRKGKPISILATFDRVETVETELGSFRTAKVDVKILEKQERGATTDATIWFTLDERRMPVKLSAAAPIGSLEAKLRAATGTAKGELAKR